MSLSKALYPLLSTGSPRKIRHNMTEKLLTGTIRIKTNKLTNFLLNHKKNVSIALDIHTFKIISADLSYFIFIRYVVRNH